MMTMKARLGMAFDFKKEYKEFYLPKNTPSIVTVPSMNYIAVRGQGDPNEEDGAYKQAIGLLYGIAFTIKMSKLGDHRIEGYFDYVVPPLEGFWWQDGVQGIDYAHKDAFQWISVIRRGDRLCAQGNLPLDLSHPPAGFCDEGGLRLGSGRSRSEKEDGLFQGGISHL